MATTLIDHATDRRDALKQQKQDAFDDFTAARKDLDEPATGHRAVRDERSRELVELNREIAAARRDLAGDHTPAQLEARVDALRALVAQRRAVEAALVEAEEEVAATEARVERSREAHRRAGAALAVAETRLAEVQARQARLDRWQTAVGEEPLDTLPERAGKARTTAPDNQVFEKARQRVETLPEPLRNRALDRYRRQQTRLEQVREVARDAEEELAAGTAQLTGPAATVGAEKADLERAEAALADFVVRGPERLATALGLLAEVAAAPAPSDEDVAAMTDASLASDGEAAATKEKERDEARAALREAEAKLEAKRLELKRTDVDADPADDGGFQTLQQDVSDAEDALATAEGAYTADMRDDLDAWEAAVPEALWSDLLAFERARRILEELESSDPTALRTAVTDAEADLVVALAAEDKAVRTVDFLRGRTGLHRDRLRVTQTLQPRRTALAIRGDV